jgi:hypothetical protein
MHLWNMNRDLARLIDTRSATVERTSDTLVEIRFKPDVKLDVAGLGEMVLAKQELCRTEEADVLAVFPSEFDFELNVLTTDHHALHGGCGLALRLAIAAGSTLNERLAHIYFRYHPRLCATAIFLDEDTARAWLTGIPTPGLS